MSKVTVNWSELQGFLPTIVQDIITSEVLAVTRTTQPIFEDLIERWKFRPFEDDPADCPYPIAQELYMDCDVDCLLVKARASLEQREKFCTFFDPLEQEVPPKLFGKNKLILAVAQDAERRDVLMAAFMDKNALRLTLSTRFVHYFSRTRQKLWKKGEKSGMVQHFVAGRYDLKAHAVVLDIRHEGGAACHKGFRSCFFRRVTDSGLEVCEERVFDPSEVYGKRTQSNSEPSDESWKSATHPHRW